MPPSTEPALELVVTVPRHKSQRTNAKLAAEIKSQGSAVGKYVDTKRSRSMISDPSLAAAVESASEWNSLLLTARADRGPQWDVGTQIFHVDAGSSLYYDSTPLAKFQAPKRGPSQLPPTPYTNPQHHSYPHQHQQQQPHQQQYGSSSTHMYNNDAYNNHNIHHANNNRMPQMQSQYPRRSVQPPMQQHNPMSQNGHMGGLYSTSPVAQQNNMYRGNGMNMNMNLNMNMNMSPSMNGRQQTYGRDNGRESSSPEMMSRKRPTRGEDDDYVPGR